MTRDTGDSAPARPDFGAMAAMAMANALPDAEIRRLQKADARPERTKLLDSSGIRGFLKPSAWEWLCADDLPLGTSPLRAVRGWRAERRGKNMLAMVGDVGIGKTVALGWLIGQVGGHYVKAEDLAKLHVTRDRESRAKFAAYMAVDALFVDELGVELDAKEARAMLTEVTDARQGRGWTGFAGNFLDLVAFHQRYDARACDRLKDSGSIVLVQGPNLRRAG